jgi:hypothetical protein
MLQSLVDFHVQGAVLSLDILQHKPGKMDDIIVKHFS